MTSTMTMGPAHAGAMLTTTKTGAMPSWLAELLSPLGLWAAKMVRQGRMAVDPQDFAQEAVCRMMATYGVAKLAETPPPVLRAIAYRAVRNMVVDESRRGGRAVSRDVLPETIDQAPSADELLTGSADAQQLESALATLAPGERRFVMAVMELDSVPAAQKRAGWPKASPYYHLRLILGRLRDHMGSGLGH